MIIICLCMREKNYYLVLPCDVFLKLGRVWWVKFDLETEDPWATCKIKEMKHM